MHNIFIKNIYKDNFFLIVRSLGIFILFAFLVLIVKDYISVTFFRISCLILLIPLTLFFLGAIRTINYKLHPAFKHLKVFGNPSKIIKEVEEELTYKIKYNGRNVKITSNWIFLCSFYNFLVIHTSEIVWVHGHHDHTDVYGDPFKINKRAQYDNFNVVINIRNGLSVNTADHIEQHLPDIMKVIFEVSPFAIFGYSKLIESLWDADRDFLIKTIDVNKAFISNGKQAKYTNQSLQDFFSKKDVKC